MFEWWLWLIHGAFFHSSISERKEQACAGIVLLLVTKTFFTRSSQQDSRLWYSSNLRNYSDRGLASCKILGRVLPRRHRAYQPRYDVPKRSKRLLPRDRMHLISCPSISSNHRPLESRTSLISCCSVGHQVTLAISLRHSRLYIFSVLLPVLSSASLTPAKQPCRHPKRCSLYRSSGANLESLIALS